MNAPFGHYMSDDQVRAEYKAQKLVTQAKSILMDAMALTDCPDMKAQINEAIDYLPLHSDWDALIRENTPNPDARSRQSYGAGRP